MMNGSGCKTCPVKDCDTLQYRGSRCSALRAQAGADSDPETCAERVRGMSDEDLAKLLYRINHSMKKALNEIEVLDWLKSPAAGRL